MKSSKISNLYIDTSTSFPTTDTTNHTHEPNEYEYLNMIIQEIDSSTERELRNIMNEMGADLIPLFISIRSKKHLLRIQKEQEQSSTKINIINLEKMKNVHRLFRYIITQLQKEDSCEERMLTLFFISYVSKFESNKALIASYPGILNSLNVNHPDENEILFLSVILNEISKDYDSKHSMGHCKPILHFLNDLLKNNHNGNHNDEAQMNAIEALKHLAEVAENQTILLSFDKGNLLDRTIAITKEYKINLKSSSLALEFISNLISRSTIESLLKCTDLLQTLFELSTTQNNVCSSKSQFDDISVKASQTMIKISVYIRPGNCVPETYLNILMKFVKDVEDVTFRVVAFECLKKLAATNENRLILANSSLFTTFICEALASDDVFQQSFATTTIYEISRNKLAARILAKSGVLIGRLMSIAIQTENPNEVSIRRQAIKSILTMTNDDRAALSIFQKDILSDLAVFVASSDDEDNEVKRSSLEAVMRLTPWL